MKKAVIYLMVVSCLLLSACGSASVLTEEGLYQCSQHVSFTDYNKYTEFISSAKGLHKKFITWDKVSVLGEVVFFTFSTVDPDNFSYRYTFQYDAEQEMDVYMYHTPKATVWYTDNLLDDPVMEIAKDSTSMSVQPYRDSAYLIKRDIFTYIYVRGNNVSTLIGILWEIDGILYELGVDPSWKEGNGTTVIDGLLSVDDAEFQTACDAIKQALSTK